MQSIKKHIKIGITQRSIIHKEYGEHRDALSQDWHSFLNIALPNVTWLPLPNIGKDIVRITKEFGINRFIFSGGETPGTSTKRDETEKFLLDMAIEKKIPTICVCRGMQFIVKEIGEKLFLCKDKSHVAVRHDIKWLEKENFLGLKEYSQNVNSFHEYIIKNTSSLKRKVNIHAIRCLDMTVEAIKIKDSNIYGIMWHPEREKIPTSSDIDFFRKVFGQNL